MSNVSPEERNAAVMSVYKVILRVAHRRAFQFQHKFEWQDLAQQALFVCLRDFDSWERDRFSLGMWVHLTASSATYHYIRRACEWQRVYQEHLELDAPIAGTEDELFAACNLYDQRPDPHEVYVLEERAKRFQAQYDRLPLRVREILRLRYDVGCTLAEVVEQTKIPERTVSTLQRQGITALRAVAD